MYYDRQIKYFDYKKDGIRQKGAGFLKIEIRDENCNLFLQISGLRPVDSGMEQVYGLWENHEELLGNIPLQGGRGSLELDWRRKNGQQNMSFAYKGLQAIRIPLKDGWELYCQVESAPSKSDEAAPEVPEVFAEQEMQEIQEESEPLREVIAVPEETARQEIPELVEEEYKEPQPMLEEKWEQLWAVYPHVVPFGDEREYLQMRLGDFVILRERFYRLVHNSFLLHGFYNYQHLILTRLERRGEKFYYIGVPGNFYDREKQVALMYGFESFECAKEPAGQGDFGYYMIRVEL